MKMLMRSLMLCITLLLLGLNAQAATKSYVFPKFNRPENLGFGSIEKFSEFLMWNMLNPTGEGADKTGSGIFMDVYIYQPTSPGSEWWASPHIEFQGVFGLSDNKPLDEFMRETLSSATQAALSEPSLDLEKEVRMEWILDENYAGTNVFKMTKASGIAPQATPSIPYTVPSLVTNEWKMEWRYSDVAVINWYYVSSSHIVFDDGKRVELPFSSGITIVFPFEYATNAYSGKLWITNQNYGGISEVFAYDLKTGDLITIQGTNQPIATVLGTVTDEGPCVTTGFTGQKHWPFRVTVKESLDPQSQTYTLHGQFNAEGRGSISLPKTNATAFIVSAEYDPL